MLEKMLFQLKDFQVPIYHTHTHTVGMTCDVHANSNEVVLASISHDFLLVRKYSRNFT